MHSSLDLRFDGAWRAAALMLDAFARERPAFEVTKA